MSISSKIADAATFHYLYPYKCKLGCGLTFRFLKIYERHLVTHHTELWLTTHEFKCPLSTCKYKGPRLDLLKRHYRHRHGERNFLCLKCSRQFYLRGQLNRHTCIIREFKCELCSETFNSKSLRNQHLKTCSVRTFAKENVPDITSDEMLQLLKDIENKVECDPKLINEIDRLTPILLRLQKHLE